MINRRLLVVSPTPFAPSDAGNRIRIGNLVAALARSGVDVHFLHVAREPGDAAAMAAALGTGRFRSLPYARPPRQESGAARLARRVRQVFDRDARHQWGLDDWYDPAITGAVLDWHREAGFDAVMVEYVFFSALFEHLPPGVLRILDTHDRFALRHRLYLAQGMAPRFFSTSVAEEARGFSRADVVVAIQPSEREAFAQVTARPVITVGHLVRVEDCFGQAPGDRPRFLVVGSENEINVDGLRRFLAEDWPLVRKALPAALLLVAGGLSKHVAARDDVLPLGFVEDIAAAYRQAHAVVNPVRSGTGLNIKSIEALGFAMPLIASPAGSRGLEDAAGSAFALAETPAALARAATRIWAEPAYAGELSASARRYAEAWNAAALGELQRLLAGPAPRPVERVA